VSAYRTAIDETARVIQCRGRNYRNQVVVVVTIAVAVAAGAAVSRSAPLLATSAVLVPVCGVFFHGDSRLLNAWRRRLLTPWSAGQLDFAAFCQAIRANPALPKPTTEAMLATLPSAGDLVSEQKVLSPTRQAVAAVSCAMQQTTADALLIDTIGSGLVVAVALVAIWSRRWIPLVGLSVLIVLPPARAWIARRRQARCAGQVEACRSQIGFSERDYTTMCATLR